MSAASLPTKTFFLTPNNATPIKAPSSPLLPSHHFQKTPYPSPNSLQKPPQSSSIITHLKKKNPWLDPFDFGDDPEMEYGDLFADGKQEEDPRPPDNPNNKYGFLKFPFGYNVEIASLGLKIRGDVRRCCCVVSGGVYENLLFFPAIQLIKDRYPGVLVDVVTSARGKQTCEINKNGRYYDMVLSTKLAGLGHATFLFMATARDRVSYIYPNVNAAGAGLLLSETLTPPGLNLSEGGYNMYNQMVEWLGRPARKVPRQEVPPLKVLISRKLKEVVEDKYTNSGAEKGKFVVIHGIQSDSQANMQSRGDPDSLLPIQVWAEIANSIKGVKPVFGIPRERERENVQQVDGQDASIVFITTPGQGLGKTKGVMLVTQLMPRNSYSFKAQCFQKKITYSSAVVFHGAGSISSYNYKWVLIWAALINDSIGVIATNTAAIQLANAREKPCVALFSSEEKGTRFVPDAEQKRCTIVSSKTGRLIDIDIDAVKDAIQFFEVSLILA